VSLLKYIKFYTTDEIYIYIYIYIALTLGIHLFFVYGHIVVI